MSNGTSEFGILQERVDNNKNNIMEIKERCKEMTERLEKVDTYINTQKGSLQVIKVIGSILIALMSVNLIITITF